MPRKQFDLTALNWQEWEYNPEASAGNAMQRTNWQMLCQLASELKDGVPCTPLDHSTNGLYNMVRLLEFTDGTLWVARVALRTSEADKIKLNSEIGVTQWVHETSSLPVPKIYAYDVSENNTVGVPYVLMEFVPGNTGMNASGGYETHHGVIPEIYRPRFYRGVAECQVKMTALRLPKIGVVYKTTDGRMDVGPFPDIGGPFDTATAYLEAWVEHKKFPRRADEILDIMRGGPAREVLDAINNFPEQFRQVAPRLLYQDNGPFPLCHPDFLHSNIIVDDAFHVLSVIDWEGACTMPLELVKFPRFLETMPRLFGPPEQYDAKGWPHDEETSKRWHERDDYLAMVRSLEEEDHTLSTCLAYKEGQELSYIMEAYDGGKMGFYDKVLDALGEATRRGLDSNKKPPVSN